MEDADPKTCHQHRESKGTAYTGEHQDGVRSHRRVNIIRCRPLEHLLDGSVDSSWHLVGSVRSDCTACTCTVKEEITMLTFQLTRWGMPAISALWLGGTTPFWGRGSCGVERYQSCNSAFFCQRKQTVSANKYTPYMFRDQRSVAQTHNLIGPIAYSILRWHTSDRDSGA